MLWTTATTLRSDDPDSRRRELEVYLLGQRQLTNSSEIKAFFSPPVPDLDLIRRLEDLDQSQLNQAAARIEKAIKDRQPILIYGDYDCDGVCATALLWEILHALGANARPFIPRRDTHGYGLSEAGLTEAIAKFDQLPLVVTVDNGITAAKTIAAFPDLEFIVTDHHTKPESLPRATIVHTTRLCGTGVAWVLASHLRGQPAETELVALATVTDLMPLLGFNRSFLVHGLKQLRQTRRPGLVALYALAGIDQSDAIDTYHLGFILGPRINAVGRLGHGLDALRLLCTRKPEAAAQLASKLSLVNEDRQVLTEEHVRTAKSLFAEVKTLPKILVASHPDFHEGIIGLVASKLVETYHRPAVVVSTAADVAKGSARSLPGIDITQILREAATGLEAELGGHVQAAGFKLEAAKLGLLIERLKAAGGSIADELLQPKLELTTQLLELDIGFPLWETLERFAPWGFGNVKPLFAISLPVSQSRLVGKNGTHLQLKLGAGSRTIPAIGFNLASRLSDLRGTAPLTWAVSVEKNVWQGHTSLQLQIKDFRVMQ